MLEGGHIGRVGLGGFARGVDLVVHDHQRAHIPRLRGCGHTHGAHEVARTIRAQLVLGMHGGREADRLGAVHGQIEEIGRLFQRIRAVGDDHAGHVRLGKAAAYQRGQVIHAVRGHGRAGQIGEFADFQRADLSQAAHAVHQLAAVEGWGRAAGGGVMQHGDGAAGGDDDDFVIHDGLPDGRLFLGYQ